MNTQFLRFNESALKSGLFQLNPVLGRELKHVAETFVTLAKSASDQTSHDDEDDAAETTLEAIVQLHDAASSTQTSRERRQPLPIPQHTNIGWGYAATLDDSPPPRNTAIVQNQSLQHRSFFSDDYDTSNQLSVVRSSHKSFLYSTSVGQIMDPVSAPSNDNSQSSEALPFGLVDFTHRPYSPPLDHHPHIYNVSIPSPLLNSRAKLPSPPPLPIHSLTTKTPKPAWTYSHDEVTFARRLTRASLETGFHLLSGANLRPAALNYVFKLSLPYMGLDELRDRFKLLLARSTEEDLDSWDTPFIHLGGAGTHYPRKDKHGNVVPVPNSWTVRNIGPPRAKLVRAESSVDPSQNHDLNIDLTGFEGEWFDANDVQGYLEEEKGCHIDPKDSFAEVFIEVEDDETHNSVELDPTVGSLLFGKKLNLDFSDIAHSSDASPGLSSGSSSEPTSSSKSTPQNSAGGMDAIFGGQSEAPFGLDMGMDSNMNGFDFGKFDHASLYDQPLGLDLAPGYDNNMNTTMAGFSTSGFGGMESLGLDLMGGEVEHSPIAKPKQKKAAWIDVSKFIDGEYPFILRVPGDVPFLKAQTRFRYLRCDEKG
jgi:hypothetical protein